MFGSEIVYYNKSLEKYATSLNTFLATAWKLSFFFQYDSNN